MSQKLPSKSMYDLLTECQERGRVETIELRKFVSGERIGVFDKYDVLDNYSEGIVMKHTRNKTKLTVWIV